MSARYSKTSSRGRATVALTVTGSKARRSLRRARHPQHRVPGLAAAHDLDLGGLLRPQRTAQLAHRPSARVDEHPLPDQRGAIAVAAAVATGLETEHAVAQEGTLEIGDGSGVAFGHGDFFGSLQSPPARGRNRFATTVVGHVVPLKTDCPRRYHHDRPSGPLGPPVLEGETQWTR